MSETVFVDASAWVAITNGKDRFHEEALRAFRHLLQSKTPFTIRSSWVSTLRCTCMGFAPLKSGAEQANSATF